MTSAEPVDAAAQARARMHEWRLYVASHPLVYAMSSLAARLGTVLSIPGVGHLVTEPVMVREVLSSPARFSKTGPGALSDSLTGVMGRSALVNMDGEAHRKLRARLQGLFTPSFAAEVVQQVFTPVLQTLCERLRRGEPVDLVRVAQVLTGRIACAILGVALPSGSEDETCLELHRAGVEFAAVLTLSRRRLGASRLARAREKFEVLTRGARAAYDSGDERCVPGRLRALGLDFEESRGVIGLLFLAGTETTASALPRHVALLVDSGQWPTLRERRECLSMALDEGLRLTAAVPVMTRNVVSPTRLGGRAMNRDDRVIVLLFKALKSPALLDEPLRFDIERDRSTAPPPLWFGHGPHFCLGAALARRELEVALTALLDLGDLAIVKRRYTCPGLLPGYGELQVRLAQRDRAWAVAAPRADTRVGEAVPTRPALRAVRRLR